MTSSFYWFGVGLVSVLPAQALSETPVVPSANDELLQIKPVERLTRTATRTVIRANQANRSIPENVKVAVSGFQVEGYPEFSEDGLKSILQPWKGKDLTLPEFEKMVHAVAVYMRENGHPNASVSVSRAQLGQGIVAMAVQGLKAKPLDAPEEAPATVLVNNFVVSGTDLATQEEFNQLLAEWAGKQLTFDQMQQLPVKVAEFLRTKGFILAQAWLPPQKIENGTLEIAVVEGKLDPDTGVGGLIVDGAGARIKPSVVERIMADAVNPDEPLQVAKLDEKLRILNEFPGIKSAKSNLIAGTTPGSTAVQVEIEEGKPFSGAIWADNFGSVYTGQERINTQLAINSPSGHGEQIVLDLTASDSMSHGKLTVSAPVGKAGTRLGVAYSTTDMDIDPTAVPINLNSSSSIVSLFGSHPLSRSARFNQTLNFGVDFKHLENKTPVFTLDDREIVLANIGINGNAIDQWGGQYAWNLVASAGDLDLSGEPGFQAVDKVTAQTEGGFAKLNWDVARMDQLGESDWTLYTNFKGQLASKNLDSSEKFQLGGPSGVRAYPVGEGIGDHGWIASAEIRRRVKEVDKVNVDVFGFADVGGITQYDETWTGATTGPNSYTLKGAGVGASVSNEHASLSITAAHKIGSNPNPTASNTDADGKNDSARIWIIGKIVF